MLGVIQAEPHRFDCNSAFTIQVLDGLALSFRDIRSIPLSILLCASSVLPSGLACLLAQVRFLQRQTLSEVYREEEEEIPPAPCLQVRHGLAARG